MLSKQKEINMLRSLAKRLGPDGQSYTGQWLREQLPFIERDIMDDVAVAVPTLAQARAKAVEIVSAAKRTVESISELSKRRYEEDRRKALELSETERLRAEKLASQTADIKRRLQALDAEMRSVGEAVSELFATATK